MSQVSAPVRRTVMSKKLIALIVCQVGLLTALLFTVVQLHRTQKVPPATVTVQPIYERLIVQERIVTEAYCSISSNLNFVSVRVRTTNGMGSAVAISPILAITNLHVVIDDHGCANTVWVDVTDDEDVSSAHVFDVVYGDEARDLALIQAPANFTFKHWAKLHAGKMSWGDQIIAVGCANSHLPLPSSGYWVRITPDGLGQMSISCFWGSSGGGVFDAKTGELAGLMVRWDSAFSKSGVTSMPNIFHCVPASWVVDFVEKYEKLEHP